MKEQEAIEIIRTEKTCVERNIKQGCNRECFYCDLLKPDDEILTGYNMAISALEEVQQYRKLGTGGELREAREKQVPKAPYVWGDGYSDGHPVYDMYNCPNCEKSYEIDGEKYDFCPNCGQAIDWSYAESEE